MSVKRRLFAAGLPLAGVTVFAAALAVAGQPVSAAPSVPVDTSTSTVGLLAGTGLRLPVQAPVAAGCTGLGVLGTAVGRCEPGDGEAPAGGDAGYGGDSAPDDTSGPDDNNAPDDTDQPAGGPEPDDNAGSGDSDGGEGPTRGNDGYGGAGPDEAPSPEPSLPPAGPDEVPGGGAGPDEAPPGGFVPNAVPGGGELPVTGSPMVLIVTAGALLTALGVGLRVYASRRRRLS